jgi:hypothetical protein
MNLFSKSLSVLVASIAGIVCPVTLAANDPSGPIEEVKAAVRDLDDAHGHYLRANDFSRALLRIVGEQPNGGEMLAANEEISQAAFGVSFKPDSTGFGTVPEAFPVVFNTDGMNSVIEDLFLLPVDAAWMPAGAVRPGTQLFIYSARFGTGPTHVGLGTVVDRWAVGAASGPDEPLRNAVTFFPIDLIDPSELVTGPHAVQFLQGSVSGAFDEDGKLHDWIFEQVRTPDLKGSSSGLSGGCDGDSLVECLQAARANLNQSLQQLAPMQGQIEELEKKLREAGKDLVKTVGQAAISGAITGAVAGAAAGPVGSLLGAIGTAALAAASSLIAWAFFDESDEVAEELAGLREQLQAKFCASIRQWAGRVRNCFSIHCPPLAADAAAIVQQELGRFGC